MPIQRLSIYAHPNPTQACPKLWGGGGDGKEDLLFWGAANKTLTVTTKPVHYVMNKAQDKLRDGYQELLTADDVAPDADDLLEAVRVAVVEASDGAKIDLSDVMPQYRTQLMQGIRRLYPMAKFKEIAAGPPSILVRTHADPAIRNAIAAASLVVPDSGIAVLSW